MRKTILMIGVLWSVVGTVLILSSYDKPLTLGQFTSDIGLIALVVGLTMKKKGK